MRTSTTLGYEGKEEALIELIILDMLRKNKRIGEFEQE
jgi:hypothetical protein